MSGNRTQLSLYSILLKPILTSKDRVTHTTSPIIVVVYNSILFIYIYHMSRINIISSLLLISICIFLLKSSNNQDLSIGNYKLIESVESVNDVVEVSKDTFIRIGNLPSNFDTVPGGNNVFRTNQPSLNQLKSILTNYDIDVVVRMNGLEGTGVSINSEKKLVESLGKKFVWVNAHLGYEKDSGYVKSLDTIQPYLRSGKVLIHCTAGADRTGYQVAKYIKDKYEWSEVDLWNYTIKYNHWEKFICQGLRGYIKYMEAFYTIDQWCEDFGKNCYHCK